MRSGISECFTGKELFVHGGFKEQQPHKELLKVDFSLLKANPDSKKPLEFQLVKVFGKSVIGGKMMYFKQR